MAGADNRTWQINMSEIECTQFTDMANRINGKTEHGTEKNRNIRELTQPQQKIFQQMNQHTVLLN